MHAHREAIHLTLVILIGLVGIAPTRAATDTAPDFEIPSPGPLRQLTVETGDSPVPWSHLDFMNDPNAFQIAIVSDRTGGARWGVFQDAIAKLNLLQPEFVMSVGDMIQGYTDDLEVLNREWDEFTGFIEKLEAPFFFVPGNHDMTNPTMAALWEERFGTAYYSFIYKDVLFLCLNSNDGAMHQIGGAQIDWVKQVLEEKDGVRWTLVFVHRPFWDSSNPEDLAYWAPIDDALAGRNYTVFAGHFHNYTKLIRNDRRYITLATTGGASGLRGQPYGEFDQVAWITVTDEGPIVANLMLDGIWDEDVRTENFRSLVRTLMDNDRDQLPSILISSDVLGATEREISVTNDLDVPIHYAVEVSVPDGIALLSDSKFDLNIPPNTVEKILLVIEGDGKIGGEFAKVAELDWSADVRSGSEQYALEGVSILHAVKSLPIEKRPAPVAIDGDLDDWNKLSFTVEEPAQIRNQPEAWQGPDDGRFRFGISYDDVYLYVAVEVDDDEVVSVPGKSPWKQDGIEIRIDADHPPANRTNDRKIIVIALSPGDTSGNGIPIFLEEFLPEGTHYSCVETETGYALEVGIPLAEINERAGGEWNSFRLNVQVDDTDGDDRGTAQLNWKPDWRTSENIPQSGTFVREDPDGKGG